MQIDERKRLILGTIVDEYIRTGEPVGSKAVLGCIGMNVSSATIRNDMAYLERAGLLEQPHTSAGRIPTYEGYRYYIDNLMSPKPLTQEERRLIDGLLEHNAITVDAVVENAVSVMSELTNMAVVAKSSMPSFSVITRVEVIPAGRRVYALLMITSSGTIKNKICRIEFDLTNEQIAFFECFINDHLQGLNIEMLTQSRLTELAVALGSYMVSLSPLLNAVYELSEELGQVNVNLHGEQNLLQNSLLRADEVVRLLTHKNELDSLLSNAFDGISVVFGQEEESFAVTNSSMILSPLKARKRQIGSFGVIGPVRVDYASVIPHIQYITDSVNRLLEAVMDPSDEDDGKGRSV